MALDHAAIAAQLVEARRTKTPIEPLSDTHEGITPSDSYAIQESIVRTMLDAGDRIVGYKLGLTSRPMQTLLGIDQPDYAAVMGSMVYDEGADIVAADYIQPRAEAEIAVMLGSDLAGPGVTIADARAAASGAAAAVEIVDSRIIDWRIKLTDTIADLASCGAILVSSTVVPIDFDLRLTGMVFRHNGEVAATGAGAAALDDPLYAVAWAANTLGELGIELEAGHVIMTGSLHAAVDIAAGDTFRADFDRLGFVEAHVV